MFSQHHLCVRGSELGTETVPRRTRAPGEASQEGLGGRPPTHASVLRQNPVSWQLKSVSVASHWLQECELEKNEEVETPIVKQKLY